MLESNLRHLESGDLIRRLNEVDIAYLFKHALVQDTARTSLLLGERKRLHRMVGDALEFLYPERRVELAPLLAQHFEAAGDDEKTLAYATLAAEAAARVNANAEALEFFTLALRVGAHMNLAHSEMSRLFLQRGRTYELQANFQAALTNYDELQAYGAQRGDPALELAALMASATIHSIPSIAYNRGRAEELSGTALELARTLNDKAAQATILWNLMLVESRVGGGYGDAVAHGEAALKIAQENNLVERTAYVLNDLGPLLVFRGQAERGIRFNLESRDMWVELENMPMLADNYGYSVMMHLIIGEFDIAIADSQEALRISREINNQWNEAFAQTWIGEAYIERGDIATAERVMLNAVGMGEKVFPPSLVMTRSDLARLYTDLGMPERGIELARLSLDVASQKFLAIRATAVGALIEAYLATGQIELARESARAYPDLSDLNSSPLVGIQFALASIKLHLADKEYTLALAACDKLIAYLTGNKFRQFMPQVWLARARALLGQQDIEQAAENLNRALQMAQEMAAQWSMWQVYAALSRMERTRGNLELATTYRVHAQAGIDAIAARTPEPYCARFKKRAANEL